MPSFIFVILSGLRLLRAPRSAARGRRKCLWHRMLSSAVFSAGGVCCAGIPSSFPEASCVLMPEAPSQGIFRGYN